MDHEVLRERVLKELRKVQAKTVLAESYDEWRSIGTALCNLDTEIDKVLYPDIYGDN